jgi:hypothetical protein
MAFPDSSNLAPSWSRVLFRRETKPGSREFVVLALTHRLENHEKGLAKTFIFVVASYVNNNPNHGLITYFPKIIR